MPAPNRFVITADADRGDHIDASTLQPGDGYVREYTGTTTNPIIRLEQRITDRTSTDLAAQPDLARPRPDRYGI